MAVNVCFMVHFNTKMNKTKECGENREKMCIADRPLYKQQRSLPLDASFGLQSGSLWENPLDLTWCNRAVHGWKTTLFFFFFFCCGCDIFQNFQPAAQYHTEQSPIKHKTSAHLQKFSYWLSSLMSFFVVYMISCHDNKSKCFGICVTPFKSTDSSAHFKFITFVHFRSRGSK